MRRSLVVGAAVMPIAGAAAASTAADGEHPEAVLVGRAHEWRYLVSTDEPPEGWQGWAHDDTSWPEGPGPFGFGDRPHRTEIPELAVQGTTLLLRQTFNLPDSFHVISFDLEMASDGPFAVYLNGIEVRRTRKALPYRVHSPTGEMAGFTVDLDGIAHELLPGPNVIALEVNGPGAEGLGFIVAPRIHLVGAEGGGGSGGAQTRDRSPASEKAAVLEHNGIRHVILMVCDGWGPQHIEAANQYLGMVPLYQLGGAWLSSWMSTFPAGGSYDPALAWTEFSYVLSGMTDSAAAATAMVSGEKTGNGRISVEPTLQDRLFTIGERARTLGMAVGAVTTVPIAHATPAAFTSHNESRGNGYAIGDEAFFGDPNTTGSVKVDPKYGGGFGPTFPPTDVLVGDRSANFLHPNQRDKLAAESGHAGRHLLVEGEFGVDGGLALLAAAGAPGTRKLAGLFDRANLRATAPDWGYRLETPSLAESAEAALTVLQRASGGFVLMVEGGAVDWAAHANNMDRMIAEMRDFNLAVEAVVDWVEDPTNGSSWSDTLVVITGDHETGYLTPAPGVFQDQPIAPGTVSDDTLALEKVELSSGRRASWVDDAPANDLIDEGETVYWAWSSDGHTNTLIPMYARGVGAHLFDGLAVGIDPVRGPFIDNTDIFRVMNGVLAGADAIFVDGFESGGTSLWAATSE